MKKLIIFTLLSTTLFSTTLFSNMFTMTDKNGKIISEQKIEHSENACLSQDEKEYSQQAIYNEINKEKNLAKKAEYAKKQYLALIKKKEEAKKIGKVYQLTKFDENALINYAKYFKGGKYVWGGTTPKGFDCSGYVQYLYKKQNINIPRTAYAQSKKGKKVLRAQFKKGDLLFFLTDKKRKIPITHVGIYIGDGKFIHAASKKKGIIISPIDYGYYSKKFVLAKRMI